MEFEICIPGLEKLWKLEEFVWVMEKLRNLELFPQIVFSRWLKSKEIKETLCQASKRSACGM